MFASSFESRIVFIYGILFRNASLMPVTFRFRPPRGNTKPTSRVFFYPFWLARSLYLGKFCVVVDCVLR